MRIAVVHDWLIDNAGAESVLARILKLYPGADVYSVVNFLKPDDLHLLNGSKHFTTFIQHLPFARSKYRNYLPLMPLAIEQFDLSAYDLVISSSYAVAKGVITGPDQIHISYVHSPIRYAWDLQHTYLKEANLVRGLKSIFVRLILHYIRIWDFRTSHGVDCFIANSAFVARRIMKIYGRRAEVVYPPVNLDQFVLGDHKEEFYLTASRFVPYKKIPLIVRAFVRMSGKRLVVIGEGPEDKAARAASGPNITFLGRQPRSVLIDYMQRARAFVFAAEEDFGIVPVEAQSCGTPVIAYGKGGALETVVDGETGVLFHEQTEEAIIAAVEHFEKISNFDSTRIRENTRRFGVPVFDFNFKAIVDRCMDDVPKSARKRFLG